jgi:hypothetical protein
MNQSNSFIETMSMTCIAINIGLFLFAVISEQPQLQLLTLFNVACFSLYFLITGKK